MDKDMDNDMDKDIKYIRYNVIEFNNLLWLLLL